VSVVPPGTVYTIGHPTHPTRELVGLLRAHGVEQVVDIRGVADYMQTDDFAAGLSRLEQLATRRPTAIMCAEAVRWRCHRSRVADALTAARGRVLHIQSCRTARLHRHPPSLKVRAGRLLYPAPSAHRRPRAA
jgi:uncharacterized protein (DUF488 family)